MHAAGTQGASADSQVKEPGGLQGALEGEQCGSHHALQTASVQPGQPCFFFLSFRRHEAAE